METGTPHYQDKEESERRSRADEVQVGTEDREGVVTDLERWAPTFRIWLFLSAGTVLLLLTILIVWGVIRVIAATQRVRAARWDTSEAEGKKGKR